jgi:ATP-dependent exoDNAse (exonuclease V) alpha subunit
VLDDLGRKAMAAIAERSHAATLTLQAALARPVSVTKPIKLISENPYRLARDIRGIGFLTADQIAAKLGIEKTALIRVRAGISYALAEAMDEGHCGLPAEELVPLTQKYWRSQPS